MCFRPFSETLISYQRITWGTTQCWEAINKFDNELTGIVSRTSFHALFLHVCSYCPLGESPCYSMDSNACSVIKKIVDTHYTIVQRLF